MIHPIYNYISETPVVITHMIPYVSNYLFFIYGSKFCRKILYATQAYLKSYNRLLIIRIKLLKVIIIYKDLVLVTWYHITMSKLLVLDTPIWYRSIYEAFMYGSKFCLKMIWAR